LTPETPGAVGTQDQISRIEIQYRTLKDTSQIHQLILATKYDTFEELLFGLKLSVSNLYRLRSSVFNLWQLRLIKTLLNSGGVQNMKYYPPPSQKNRVR